MSAGEEKAITVGRIAGVFGVKGWLKVKSFTQPIENIVHYQPWRLLQPTGAPGALEVTVEEWQQRPQGLICRLANVHDRDQAQALGRPEIQVAASQLPELSEGDFYWHQLVGLQVVTSAAYGQQRLGEIRHILETGANDVLVVKGDGDSMDRRERLIPYVPERYVLRVDLPQRLVEVDWDPEF